MVSGTLGAVEPVFTEADGTLRVGYEALISDRSVRLDQFVGAGIRLTFTGERRCIHCQNKVRKLFARSYCFDCFSTLARCDLCFVSPDRCHFEHGTCREPEWAQSTCMQPHTVYLAVSSGAKIGITRQGREWRRWADQGASEGLAILSTPSRRMAGIVEAHFKRRLSDRTDWRRLVSGNVVAADLTALRDSLRGQQAALIASVSGDPSAAVAAEWPEVRWLLDGEVTKLSYPLSAYSPPVRRMLSEQTRLLHDNLVGVVGQFLLLGQGVFNLADHRAMAVQLEITDPLPEPGVEKHSQMSLFGQGIA